MLIALARLTSKLCFLLSIDFDSWAFHGRNNFIIWSIVFFKTTVKIRRMNETLGIWIRSFRFFKYCLPVILNSWCVSASNLTLWQSYYVISWRWKIMWAIQRDPHRICQLHFSWKYVYIAFNQYEMQILYLLVIARRL